MNDTETTPELTVMTDGITVEKRYETDSFTVPAVAFRFRSDRDGETLIRLTDTIPPDVPPEDIGFHPNYGNDYWTVEDDTVIFERRFEPNEAYETVYAIRTSDHDPEGFMTDPSLDVQGVDDAETQEPDAATPDTSHTTDDDAITDDGVDEGDDIAAGDETDDGESEGIEDQPHDRETRDTGDTRDTEDTRDTTVPADGIGAALAAELREGSLSEADRELIEAELTGEEGSTDVRMTHLQSRVSDLEAYTDALEEFFDENGTVEEYIDETTARLETLEAELDDVADRTNENETTVAEFESRIEKNEADIDSIDKAVADIQADFDELQESVADLRADVAEIDDWQGQVSSVFGGAPEADNDSSDEE